MHLCRRLLHEQRSRFQVRRIWKLVKNRKAFDVVRLTQRLAVSRQCFRITRNVHDAIEPRAKLAHAFAHARSRWVDEYRL